MYHDNKQRPLISFKFEGPGIHDGRILYDDLSMFVSSIRLAIQRIINGIQTGESIRTGRPARTIQVLSALEIVSMRKGSFRIGLDLRRDGLVLPKMDLGEEATDKLVTGIKHIAIDKPLPKEFDEGVLTTLRDAGRVIERGISTVRINSETSFGIKKAVYFQQTRIAIIRTIQRYQKEYAVIEGRLLGADVKEDRLRCRIEPSIGEPINCRFDEIITEQVIHFMRQFVQARGEAIYEPLTNKVTSFHIRDIEPIETLSGMVEALNSPFWRIKKFEELAAEQNVHPIEDLSNVIGGWPEDEDIDQFLDYVRSTR